MQQKLLIILFLATFGARAQNPIFDSNMTVVEGGYIDSPYDEGVGNSIDGDVNTKF